jgi:hypothetical protein
MIGLEKIFIKAWEFGGLGRTLKGETNSVTLHMQKGQVCPILGRVIDNTTAHSLVS